MQNSDDMRLDDIRLDDPIDGGIDRYNLDAERVYAMIDRLEATGMPRGEARLRAIMGARLSAIVTKDAR
jgi:hypothetical protein